MNASFAKWDEVGSTIMGNVGATMGKDQVQVDVDGALTINGEAKQDGTYQVDVGSVTKQGKSVILNDGEYSVAVNSQTAANKSYLDVDFKSTNVAADGVMPHGLWGQTADGDDKVRNGDQGAGAQGGGAIEKLDGSISEKGDKTTVNLYEVANLFDTSFANFNRFNS
ncbi:MAG: hypothetical protein L3K52_03955 [Candidatus Thiothrix sulfatifontis]|nr:MAG: hypothetical protein L3K52_03955 [Candidatus Thiothrix sulfatifontis]